MKTKRVTAAGPVEGPWALPSGWQWKPLGSLGEFINGAAFKPTDWGEVGTPIIRIQNLNHPDRPMNRTSRVVSERLKVRENDLLVSWSATLDAFVWRGEEAWLNQHIFKVVPDQARVQVRYMFFLLKNEIENLKKTEHLHGSTMMHINRGPFLAHLVPVPPLQIQSDIARRIDELFAEIDDGEAALARARTDLATWRRSLLKAAVTGELTADWRAANAPGETGVEPLFKILRKRQTTWEEGQGKRRSGCVEPTPSNNTVQPTLPTGWVWASVQQLSQVVRGASPRPAGDPRFFGGTIPWITVGALTRNHSKYLTSVNQFVTELGRDHSRFVQADTLLFTNSGATLGVPRITKIGGCINDGSVALLNMDEPVKSYVYYFLQTQTEKLRALNQGAAQPNLNTTIVKEIRVPLPPIKEIYEIVANLERLLDEQDACEDDIKDLKGAPDSLRQSILAAAFRGELS